MKTLLIIDNDDQTEAIDKINSIAQRFNLGINCIQFNVGLPDGNDVVNEQGRIDLNLVMEKFEREYSSRRFHMIAFDFKLNEPEEEKNFVDGVSLIKRFNSLHRLKNSKKILYSSELNEIVETYLNDYRDTSDFESAWGKFKTLINLEIVDFCKREDYEEKVVEHIKKVHDQGDDFLIEELKGNGDLKLNAAVDVYEGLTLNQIAKKIEEDDNLSESFKKKILALTIAHLSHLDNE
ncbi:hypothetical protein [uncultured Fluviicola sp.]|uniref:hypothetical protein n=1 Tax=uncultured Fluviicola sp. TaxID=463303 RepID=UPI0025F1D394|nr:hypothetical protein [uncultured Fluviicola sp.]